MMITDCEIVMFIAYCELDSAWCRIETVPLKLKTRSKQQGSPASAARCFSLLSTIITFNVFPRSIESAPENLQTRNSRKTEKKKTIHTSKCLCRAKLVTTTFSQTCCMRYDKVFAGGFVADNAK